MRFWLWNRSGTASPCVQVDSMTLTLFKHSVHVGLDSSLLDTLGVASSESLSILEVSIMVDMIYNWRWDSLNAAVGFQLLVVSESCSMKESHDKGLKNELTVHRRKERHHRERQHCWQHQPMLLYQSLAGHVGFVEVDVPKPQQGQNNSLIGFILAYVEETSDLQDRLDFTE